MFAFAVSAIEPSFNQIKRYLQDLWDDPVSRAIHPVDAIHLAMMSVSPVDALAYFRWAGYDFENR
eukprot:SAG31_NODE_30349_length_382_cov_0.918728_1_plen_64_part_01